MVRPRSNDPKISKHISLSVYNVARMELELFSDLEGRVPVGAQGELIDRLLTAHFRRLDAGAGVPSDFDDGGGDEDRT